MADKFIMSARQAAELDHAFERNGWTSAEVKKLSSGRILEDFREVILGNAIITLPGDFIDLNADPLVPDGLTVVEHRKGGRFKWDSAKVKLYVSRGQRGGSAMEGNRIREELKDKPVFNVNLLNFLLKNPHLIPEKWKARHVVFWGTIYRGQYDNLFVSCLRFVETEDRWVRDKCLLRGGFYGGDPAAVLAR